MFYRVMLFFFAISCLINGLYYLWVGLLLLSSPITHQKDRKYSKGSDIHFFLLIPCLNEGKVVAATVRNLLSLKMPNTKIVVINDGSTDNTLEVLKRIKSRHLTVLNRLYPNVRQGKGQVLNYAYNYVKGVAESQCIDPFRVVLGVIDADTSIRRRLLERVAVIMDNEAHIGMVQTRIRIGSSTRYSILSLMQDLEFYTYINQMQNLREYTGTVAAAGNGQFNRLAAINLLGDQPWSKCLLEDFDFSLRMLMKGWRTCLLQDESTHQQGVLKYKKFVKQRARWAQGCVQCIPYLRSIIKCKHLTLAGKAEVFSFLMLPWVTLTSISALIFSWLLILYSYWTKSSSLSIILGSYPSSYLLVLLIIIVVIIYFPGITFSISYWRDTKESIYICLLAGLLVPIYNLLQSPAVIIAVFRQTIRNNAWVKTERV